MIFFFNISTLTALIRDMALINLFDYEEMGFEIY